MATIEFSERALSDLERLFDFIAEHDPTAARAAAQRIAEAVRILERHPLIGHPYAATCANS